MYMFRGQGTQLLGVPDITPVKEFRPLNPLPNVLPYINLPVPTALFGGAGSSEAPLCLDSVPRRASRRLGYRATFMKNCSASMGLYVL